MRRPYAIAAGGAVAALALVVILLSLLAAAKGRLSSLESSHMEMRAIKEEYMALSRKVEGLEKRKSLTRAQGIVQAVDTISDPLGLKDKVKSVKPLSPGEAGEERAEVTVETMEMNEMVNLLYTIENAPMLLLMRKINIKTSFENPQRLTVTITLSLIKPE